MALSKEDFLRATPDNPPKMPKGVFGPPKSRGPEWPDFPDLRKAVEWFKSYLPEGDWEKRRIAAFVLLHQRAYGMSDPDAKGRYFDSRDTFGWYLFLAEAFLDHMWNYEPMFGSRVIPVFAAVGRNRHLLEALGGVDERMLRIVGSERSQPNGGIFELLTAAAYCRHGAKVSFRPETKGTARSWDLDVELGGRAYAVECKRMETSEYGDRERSRMRQLWGPVAHHLAEEEISTFCNVDLFVAAGEVPAEYFAQKVVQWRSAGNPSMLWKDEISEGVVGEMDLGPLQRALETDDILSAGTRLHQLLAGRYIRHANYNQVIRFKQGVSPRYMGDCDLAILFRWQNSSTASIGAKARDVLRKLAEAHDQLPGDTDSIVHIGFEAVEGDEVEKGSFRENPRKHREVRRERQTVALCLLSLFRARKSA
ncbi:transposase (plasmid) [Sinorhizobium medicae]|uniref:transposase n=1 Tax=Sinorhizobium medicae TaxID=110321 RepID=UPI002AF6BFB4|nr:transposase [Sinorhizobium medicae]WQO88072.1 transposase [Sinorhizobium medicae]